MKNIIRYIAIILGLSLSSIASAQPSNHRFKRDPGFATSHFESRPHKAARSGPTYGVKGKSQKKSKTINWRGKNAQKATAAPKHQEIKMKKSRSGKAGKKAKTEKEE